MDVCNLHFDKDHIRSDSDQSQRLCDGILLANASPYTNSPYTANTWRFSQVFDSVAVEISTKWREFFFVQLKRKKKLRYWKFIIVVFYFTLAFLFLIRKIFICRLESTFICFLTTFSFNPLSAAWFIAAIAIFCGLFDCLRPIFGNFFSTFFPSLSKWSFECFYNKKKIKTL